MDILNATAAMPEVIRFHTVDYVIFILMLCVSIAIGFYYACTGGKQRTASEYLMGNRSMGKFPIAMSLTASFMSSIAMLGMPSEVYMYGVGYLGMVIGLLIALPLAGYVYLPMFYDLQLTSTIEYIERRFNKRLRYVASLLFIIAMWLYAAFVIYGPAISLRQVTGMNIWGSIATIGLIGTLYTCVGGIKAVMWTDVVQVTVMMISILVLCIKGTIDVGGIGEVVSVNIKGERLYMPSFSLDPRIRYSFWGCVFAPVVGWCTTYGVYQTQVQRYLSAPTKSAAQKALWLNVPGVSLLFVLCSYVGFILYTKYHGCDPLSTNQMEAPDQIAPLFVMETMSVFPGLPGLFVAGVFSGSLSTISSVFNSLAAVVLEDFVKQTDKWKNINEEQAAKASKFIALAFGLLSLLLASLGDFMGGIIQSSQYNISIFTATYFGIFVLGMFFPWATSRGTEIGVVLGMAFGIWFSIGSQSSTYISPRPPVSIEDCPAGLYNASAAEFYAKLSSADSEDTLEFYKISYVWINFLVTSSVIIFGMTASILTGPNKINDVNPRYITSITKYLLKFIYKSSYKWELPSKDIRKKSDNDVETNLPLIQTQENGVSLSPKENGYSKVEILKMNDILKNKTEKLNCEDSTEIITENEKNLQATMTKDS